MPSQAVVIAPAGYAPDSGLEPHASIAVSARMYERVLREDPLWGEGRYSVLTSDQLSSASSVMTALQLKADLTEPGDTFLVIYIGHGAYWTDAPDGQVHFAVDSSRKKEPWTWLSSWYLYRTMRGSPAGLKVLIADCCYSNMLPHLGAGRPQELPGVLGQRSRGTCVLTAIKDQELADPQGCPHLPEGLAQCTTFSGHLLHQLQQGTKSYDSDWTLGLLRDAVEEDMEVCDAHEGQTPNMILNAREATRLFTNHVGPGSRSRVREPQTVGDWVKALKVDTEGYLPKLLQRPQTVGEIVATLRRTSDDQNLDLAQRIDTWACGSFEDPQAFYRYWTVVEEAMRSVQGRA